MMLCSGHHVLEGVVELQSDQHRHNTTFPRTPSRKVVSRELWPPGFKKTWKSGWRESQGGELGFVVHFDRGFIREIRGGVSKLLLKPVKTKPMAAVSLLRVGTRPV